jgi:hypothetical protein
MSKRETIRRLLVGDLRRVYHHRYGPALPDDDAGREDLELILMPISLAPKAAAEKMKYQIEILAPWMPEPVAAALIDNLMQLPLWYRRPSFKEVGERIRLTNAEREMFKAWRIAPVDMTAADMAEQRKAKKKARDTLRRRQAGVISRQAYLANAKTRQKRWEAEGISRATWYRQRETGPRSAILTKADADLSQTPVPSGTARGPTGGTSVKATDTPDASG